MLVIDESRSLRAHDIAPTRMAAAKNAATQFADELTPGINLGLIAYGGTATGLVSPTTDRTATGEAISTALQASAPVGAVIDTTVQQQIGFESIRGDASTSWLRLGAFLLVTAALAALLINGRLPG